MLTPGEPVLTADGSWTRHSERYGQTFHSHHGAVTEARHVFLEASGVAERLRGMGRTSASGIIPALTGTDAGTGITTGTAVQPDIQSETKRDIQPGTESETTPGTNSATEAELETASTHILEIGFGLGLNCLLTADLACLHGAALSYHAVEHDSTVLAQTADMHYERLLQFPELHQRLAQALAAQYTGRASVSDFITLSPGIELMLYLADAVTLPLPPSGFHAIYLDAFSPDSNPECWSVDFLRRLFHVTRSGGALTTYSAKGDVRRALMAAGYSVERLPGPPGKREMLRATRKSG